MRSNLILLATMATLLLAVPCAARSIAIVTLDGKAFNVSMLDAEQKKTSDVLEFKKGTFDSTDCKQWGFSAAPYKMTMKNGVMTFTSTTTSTKEGTMVWSGTVTGDAITGRAVWSKKGQKVSRYTFSGTLKK